MASVTSFSFLGVGVMVMLAGQVLLSLVSCKDQVQYKIKLNKKKKSLM